MILVWAVGTGLYLLAMARWLWLERRLAKTVRLLDDPCWQTLVEEMKLQFGIHWAVAVGVSHESEVPLTIGWRRPKILLPVDYRCWTAIKCRAVLAHELSHVARHDVFWQVVARLACAVYWFHPPVWLAERRMRVERELACDDAVLRSGNQPDQYAAVLLDVAAAVGRRPPARAAVIAMACRHPIQRRIRAILQPGLNRLPVGPRTGRLLLGAALLLAVLAAGLHPFAPPQVQADPAKSTVVAATKSEKPDVRSVRFRVLNQAGKPIVGAKVKLWGVIRESLARFYPPAANTDGEGVAVIEFPRQTTSYVVAFVWADDYVTAGAHWDNDDEGGIHVPTEFTFTLEAGTTLGGVVRDDQGRTIAGAQVVVSGEEKLPGGIHFNQADDNLRTDAQGRWTSHRVPKDLGRYVAPRIALKHPAYASPPAFDLNSQPLDQLRAGTAVMVMHKGCAVEGVVADPQGRPVAGAAVGQFEDLSGSDFPRATTDQEGHYRLPACEAGEYTIAAAAKGYAPDSRRVTVGERPPTVDLRLRKGDLIRVRVVDKQGRPLQGATIGTIFDNEYRHAMMLDYQSAFERDKDQHSLADAEGRWSKLWILGDTIHLSVTNAGYAAVRKNVSAGEPECVIVLEAGGWRLSGRVVDRDTKAPITKFYVVEGNNYGPLLWRKRTAVENATGEYAKRWDNSGDSHRVVRIEADGYLPSKPLTLNPSERAATFNLELQKGKEIGGVVRGPNGKPVAGAEVALASATRLVLLQNSRPDGGQNSLLARTGADGRFAIAPQSEAYILVALHDLGFGRIDGDANRNEITLQPWARIEGMVYVDGRPAAKEQVRINFDDDGMNTARNPWGQTNPGRYLYYDYQTQTDDKGHFVLVRVRPGSATISRFVKVSQEGMMSGWQDADTRAIDIIPGQTLIVDLGTPNDGSKPRADAANAKVAGKVIDENGRMHLIVGAKSDAQTGPEARRNVAAAPDARQRLAQSLAAIQSVYDATRQPGQVQRRHLWQVGEVLPWRSTLQPSCKRQGYELKQTPQPWPAAADAPALRALLTDKVPGIRALAAEALATLHQPEDVSRLAALLNDHADAVMELQAPFVGQQSFGPVVGPGPDAVTGHTWHNSNVASHAAWGLDLMLGDCCPEAVSTLSYDRFGGLGGQEWSRPVAIDPSLLASLAAGGPHDHLWYWQEYIHRAIHQVEDTAKGRVRPSTPGYWSRLADEQERSKEE
ncbi:MAG: M56 family metallopeptidase, partial [Thermoguttaceae bacterium]